MADNRYNLLVGLGLGFSLEEVVAVALGRIVLDGGADERLQEDVALEGFQQRRFRLDSSAARTPAGAEMAELHAGVENAGGIGGPIEDRHGHRATDVGRVHARMDRVPGRRDAADRDRAEPVIGWAGVGHDRGRDDRGHPHQFVHVARDGLDVGAFRIVLGLDVGGPTEDPGGAQRRRRRRREAVEVFARLRGVGEVAAARFADRVLPPGRGLIAEFSDEAAGDSQLAIPW
jgi:hypothetical protein